MTSFRSLALAALAGAVLAPAAVSAQDLSACWLRGETTPEQAAERPSPLGVVAIEMHGQTAQVCYSRPSANGRVIFGELVPFGELWRTGANEATQLHLPFKAQVGGVEVEPGVYSLYTIPGENEWEFFLSSNFQRWGIPVSDEVRAAEVASFKRPVTHMDEAVETFTIRYEAHGGMMGHLVFEWENTRVELPVHHGDMAH